MITSGRLVLAVAAAVATAGLLVGTPSPAEALAARSLTLAVSDADVQVGEEVTLSGRVTRTPRGGTVLVERRSGSSWRSVATTRTTSPSGAFRWSTTTRTKGETVYRARVPATRTAEGAVSPSRRVRAYAPASATLSASQTQVSTRSTVQFTGQAQPFAPGTSVVLERQRASGWAVTARGTVARDGTFALAHTFDDSYATVAFRARVARTTTYVGATTSPVVRVTVSAPPRPTFEETKEPTVSGTFRVGETLEVDPGNWTPRASAYDVIWLRDGEPLPDATRLTYTATPDDLDHRLSVRVSGVHYPSYATATRTSTASVVGPGVFGGPGASASGSPQVGETLTASAGSTPQPDGVSWQWMRDAAPVPGATSSRYTLTAEDLGRLVTVEAVATRRGFTPRTTRAPQFRVTSADRVSKVSGTITRDTTWSPTSAGTYVLDGEVVVASGVTLTIQPGTVVKARRGSELVVHGTLTGRGTADRPLVLTSWLDDTVGVDVSAEPQTPGIQDWSVTGAGGSVVDIVQADVRHIRFVDTLGTLSVVDSRLTTAIGVEADIDTAGEDLRLLGSSVAAVNRNTAAELNRFTGSRSTPGALEVRGNTFVGGLVVTSRSSETVPTMVVKDNTVRAAVRPFTIRDEHLRPSTLTGNTFTDATVPALFVGGRLVEDRTIRPSDVPWVVDGLRVGEGATLVVAPGAVLKTDLSDGLRVDGTLVAEAVSGDAPVLTSVLDDSVGAVLSGEHSRQHSLRLGSWAGVSSGTEGTLRFLRADVRYAGSISSYGDLTVRDSRVAVREGIQPIVQDAGVDVRISGNDILTEGGRAVGLVRTNEGDGAGILEVTSNRTDGSISAFSSRTATSAPLVIRGNRLGAPSHPLSVTDAALRPSNVLDNTFDDANPPVVHLGGRLVESWSVPTTERQFVLTAGDGAMFVVDARATLTVPSRAVLKIDDELSLRVEGSLDVRGTSGSPAVLTGVHDSTVGSEVVPPDFRRAPEHGDWSGVLAEDGGTLRFEHADVRYPRRIGADDAAFSFVDSRLDSSDGLGAFVERAGRSVLVARSTVRATERRTAVSVGRSYDQQGSPPGSVTVTSNILTGGISAASSWRTPTTPMVVRDNTVRAAQVPLTLADQRLVPSNLTGNTFSDASVPAVHLSGRLAESWTIGPADPPVVIDEDQLTVLAGATLTLRPGTVMKFRDRSALRSEGLVVAEGTQSAPIVLTSWLDSTVGVDVTRGSGRSPEAGDWFGIVTQNGGTARLRNVEQRYVDRPTG